MTAEATAGAKEALRRRVASARRERRRRRDAAAAAAAAAADAAAAEMEADADAELLATAVLALVRERTAGRVCRVAAYESLPTEPPTQVLVRRLREAGHEVVVPVTLPDRDLDWRVLERAGEAGEREGVLLGREAIREAVVVVVPGLAADRSGHRLGRGGGSYDRALARCGRSALVVVLLHDDELLEAGAVPVDAHDVPVDVAVTPALGAVHLGTAKLGVASPWVQA